jgi:hypothetical protein
MYAPLDVDSALDMLPLRIHCAMKRDIGDEGLTAEM